MQQISESPMEMERFANSIWPEDNRYLRFVYRTRAVVFRTAREAKQ